MTLRNCIQARRKLHHGRSRQEDDLAGRIDDFTQAINLNPALAEAYYERGKSRYCLSEYETALADLSEAIRLKPSLAPAYYHRATLRLNMEDFQGTVEDMTEFIRFDPYDYCAYFIRGQGRGGSGDFNGAVEDFTRVLEMTWRPSTLRDKHGSMVFMYRGHAHREAGYIDKALRDYDMAVQLDPLDEECLFHRATAYLDKGNMEPLALADLSAVLEIDPDYENAILVRADTYLNLRQIENAITDYSRAITLDPDNYCPFVNRGELYFVRAEYALALNDFREALRLKPDFAMAQADLAITLHKIGDISEAQSLWQQLIETDTQYRDIAWVKTQYRWDDALAEEAQKLIASLQ